MKQKEIVLSNIASILHKTHFIIKQNGEFMRILRCCGLGEEYEKYKQYLQPYKYNGKYENDNKEYNVYLGLENIFIDLYSNKKIELLMGLLKEIIENINPFILGEINSYAFEQKEIYSYEDNYETYLLELFSLYKIMGFTVEFNSNNTIKATLLNREGYKRAENIFSMETWLNENYEEVYKSYEGAITSYKEGHYGTCIEACRTTITGLFSFFKGKDDYAKWVRGVANLSGDINDGSIQEIMKNINEDGKKTLSSLFGENIEGKFKKTRAIYAIYSMLSDYGTHRGEGEVEIPTCEDALMMLRMTEDIIIWVFMKIQNN